MTPTERPPLRVWLVLGAGLAVLGSSAILIRFATDAPGLAVAVWRTLFATLLLAPIAWAKSGDEMRQLPRRDLALIGVAGVVLGLHFIAWIESLYHTTVASASVLVTTSPLFIAVLGYLVLRERLRPRTVVAIATAVLGAAMIGLADANEGAFPNAALGNGLALFAALLVSVYLLIGRVVRQRVSLLAYLLPLYSVAAVTCVIAALVSGTNLVQPWPILALCLLMALGPQLLGHGSFNYAVRYLPAAQLGLLSLSEPIVSSVLALFLFREIPPLLAIAGMSIVLVSIAVVFVRRG